MDGMLATLIQVVKSLLRFHTRRAVFVHNGWRIADIGEDLPVYDANQRLADPVSLFLSAYVPLVSPIYA